MPTGRRQGRIMIEYRCRVEGDRVLKNFRISIGKEDRVVQAPIENSKPA
jgi:hypothetical protein